MEKAERFRFVLDTKDILEWEKSILNLARDVLLFGRGGDRAQYWAVRRDADTDDMRAV